jgi:hypothetical protein
LIQIILFSRMLELMQANLYFYFYFLQILSKKH